MVKNRQNNMKTRILLLSLFAVLTACKATAAGPADTGNVVRPGIEVLESRGFEGLVGKRVGLVTNPSGVTRDLRSTIDVLYHAPGVDLVALYGPEHGVRGDVYAGGTVQDGTDPATGIPVYSIFGAHRKPTPEMLKGVDVVVYDIQDVGSRSYTFISTLGLVMRACAEQGIEVMVLDRPNPLGGLKVEGCYTEQGFYSFVSEFAIPYIYGLTVGELALLINEEGLNLGEKGTEAHESCKLTVIPMEGWNRGMLYADTKLPWVLPSPNIPDPQSAIGYPSAGIAGEFNGYLNIGVGYTLPFQVFAAEWIDAKVLKERLDSYRLPGIAFREIHYKPLFGAQSGILIHGVQYFYTDYEAADITLTQFYVMQAVHELWPDHDPFSAGTRNRMFDIVCGTDYVRIHFGERFKVADILDYWTKDAASFRKLSAKYYLY